MSKPTIQIKSDYKRKDGTSALTLRLFIGGKYIKISLNLYCSPELWDKTKQRAKGATKEIKTLNLQLQEVEGRAADIILRYKVQKMELTAERFEKEFHNPTVFVDFIKYMEDNIRMRKHELTDSTRKMQLSVLNKLKSFRAELLMADIDEVFLRKFEHYLRVKLGNGSNTVHKAFTTIKTYLSKAVRQELIKNNAMNNYMPKAVTTHPEYLSESEVQQLLALYNADVLPYGQQAVLRQYLFVCFTGVRISDLRSVTKKNVNEKKHLIYNPVKLQNVNNIRVVMPLSKTALRMIEEENSKTEFLFNCIKDQKMNEYLKKIFKKAGIDMPSISFHSGRHTFATTFLKTTKAANGLLILQRLLGHAKITQTIQYAHVITTDLEEAMHEFDS